MGGRLFADDFVGDVRNRDQIDTSPASIVGAVIWVFRPTGARIGIRVGHDGCDGEYEGGRNPNAAPVSNTFEAMYSNSVDTVMHGTGQETFEAVRMLKSADPSKYKPAPGVDYPAGDA